MGREALRGVGAAHLLSASCRLEPLRECAHQLSLRPAPRVGTDLDFPLEVPALPEDRYAPSVPRASCWRWPPSAPSLAPGEPLWTSLPPQGASPPPAATTAPPGPRAPAAEARPATSSRASLPLLAEHPRGSAAAARAAAASPPLGQWDTHSRPQSSRAAVVVRPSRWDCRPYLHRGAHQHTGPLATAHSAGGGSAHAASGSGGGGDGGGGAALGPAVNTQAWGGHEGDEAEGLWDPHFRAALSAVLPGSESSPPLPFGFGEAPHAERPRRAREHEEARLGVLDLGEGLELDSGEASSSRHSSSFGGGGSSTMSCRHSSAKPGSHAARQGNYLLGARRVRLASR